MAASFDSAPGTSYATDVAAWSGGFAAIGSAWETEFHVGEETPALWTSVDGESWVAQPVALGVDNMPLIGIAPLVDGRLLMVGSLPAMGANPDRPALVSAAWVSEDGITWQGEELPVVQDAVIDSFDHGPRGYVLSADGDIWYSADGMDWTVTYEGAAGVAAGDEGFVAISTVTGQGGVIASGDGQTWYASGSIADGVSEVSALGGDWVAIGGSANPPTITVWRSANGLEWTQEADVNDLTGPDGPKTGLGLEQGNIAGVSLAGGAGYAFLTLTNNHCCAQMSWNVGVYGTADGMTWASVLEGGPFVSSVASNGDTTVLAGHLGRGDDAAFWIGDQ